MKRFEELKRSLRYETSHKLYEGPKHTQNSYTHKLIQTLNTDADLTATQTRNDRTTQYSK